MAVYSVEGKLGTGKTKFAVWRAREALLAGRRVASNVELRLEALCPRLACSYVRVPDKPTAADLDAIGHGNPGSYDEDLNGVLILDELGTWLNSRSFQDKGRAPLIDWLIHARKHGWDVYLIVQDAGMIDRQVREALIEYQCRCVRLDKVRLPVLGGLLKVCGDVLSIIVPRRWVPGRKWDRFGYLPRMHVVTARVGYGAGQVVAERWIYRGDDLHAGYDTRQVFKHDPEARCQVVSWTPPPPRPGLLERLRALLAPPPRPTLRPKLPEVAALAALPPSDAWVRARELARSAP